MLVPINYAFILKTWVSVSWEVARSDVFQHASVLGAAFMLARLYHDE